ncbi:MAG: 50S ribosomal protein L6 [Candidatus Auribacterota bacterium]
MSRIGKLPVIIPAGVQVDIKGRAITVKGSKGTLSYDAPESISVVIEDGSVVCSRSSDVRREKALHGLVRNLVQNMIIGVSKGYTKKLEIHGVGYRAKMDGTKLDLTMGFSHPMLFPAPAGITIAVEGNTKISINGIDKQKVGQVAADIRAIYPPEPYKGKGIRYEGEQVRRKAGKSVGK